MADTIKIADLIAQFGLDAGPLFKGLEDTEVRIDAVGTRVISLNALFKQLGEGANFGTKFQQQFNDLRAAAELAYEQRVQAAAQERELNRQIAAEEKEQLEQRKAARASYIAWWKHALETQAEEEKAAQDLIAFNEKRDIEDQKAERARYIAWWARTIDEQVALHRAGQEAMVVATEDATAKQIISNFKLRTEAQAMTEMIGVKGLGAISRLVAYSPIVASALESIFDVVLIGAFIDILIHAGEQFETLTRYVEGFGAANIKAWNEAREGSEKATEALLKYHSAQREVEAAGLRGAGKYDTEGKIAGANLDEQKQHLAQLQEQAKAVAQLLQQAGFSGPGFGTPSAAARLGLGGILNPEYEKATQRIKDQGDTVETLAARYKHLQDEIRDTATEIGKLGQTVEKDKLKEERAPVRGQQKTRGPEDREEPNRLPWYLGPNAAQSFANKVHAQRMVGLPTATGRMFARAESDGGSAAPTASVNVNTNISPQFTFHGIPADIQAFMRDHAEPQLAKDIELNTRGIGARVAAAIKESGMVVSGV